jgi:hypothetical protein
MCGLQKYTHSHGRTDTEIIFANGGSVDVPWDVPRPSCSRRHIESDVLVYGAPAIPDAWPGPSFQVTALVALIVTWCLLAVAAIVTASVRRFQGACMYFVAAGLAVGLAIVTAIVLVS